jgi:HD-like signal output (HDOD) protein/signal transduction histidine kinase
VELLLGRIDTLPTLSPVAVAVLECSTDPDSDMKRVAGLIASDPALSARVLRMCRMVGRATREPVTTVERAVVMLGLEAVRSLMLSVEIAGVLNEMSAEPGADGGGRRGVGRGEESSVGGAFDRDGFWRHSVGTACAAEVLAERGSAAGGGWPTPSEAFLAGLLHDLGKLVLDRIVPKAFGRSVALAGSRREDLVDVERAVIGLDHHTVGKRLGEYWGLPHALQDVMWLNGQPSELMPELPHARLISLVTVARSVCVACGIGSSGEGAGSVRPAALCEEHGIDAGWLDGVEEAVLTRLQERLDFLGFADSADDTVLLGTVARANRALGELNRELRQRAEVSDARGAALGEVRRFLASGASAGTGAGLMSAMGRVSASARRYLGSDEIVVLWRARDGEPFVRGRFDAGGELLESGDGGCPPSERWLGELREGGSRGAFDGETLGWLSDQAMGRIAPSCLSVALLPTPDGPTGLILYGDSGAGGVAGVDGGVGLWTLSATWGASLAAAAQHEGARRLSERLADSNRRLGRAQRELVDARSMARLGEMTAGAAHEMNNPLAVLCGHAELLLGSADGEGRRSAEAILDAANKLSDLVSDLHLFATPREPSAGWVETEGLIVECVERAADRVRGVEGAGVCGVEVRVEAGGERVYADAEQVGDALTELIVNGLEAGGGVCVSAWGVGGSGSSRVVISVADGGAGISDHAIRHAFDPFFSEKPAGRQTGMGLARAGRLAGLNGGEIRLRRVESGGTEAQLELRAASEGAGVGPSKRAA